MKIWFQWLSWYGKLATATRLKKLTQGNQGIVCFDNTLCIIMQDCIEMGLFVTWKQLLSTQVMFVLASQGYPRQKVCLHSWHLQIKLASTRIPIGLWLLIQVRVYVESKLDLQTCISISWALCLINIIINNIVYGQLIKHELILLATGTTHTHTYITYTR